MRSPTVPRNDANGAFGNFFYSWLSKNFIKASHCLFHSSRSLRCVIFTQSFMGVSFSRSRNACFTFPVCDSMNGDSREPFLYSSDPEIVDYSHQCREYAEQIDNCFFYHAQLSPWMIFCVCEQTNSIWESCQTKFIRHK